MLVRLWGPGPTIGPEFGTRGTRAVGLRGADDGLVDEPAIRASLRADLQLADRRPVDAEHWSVERRSVAAPVLDPAGIAGGEHRLHRGRDGDCGGGALIAVAPRVHERRDCILCASSRDDRVRGSRRCSGGRRRRRCRARSRTGRFRTRVARARNERARRDQRRGDGQEATRHRSNIGSPSAPS